MDLNRLLRDDELRDDLLEALSTDEAVASAGAPGRTAGEVERAAGGLRGGLERAADPDLEAIIRRTLRPVLFIQDGQIEEPEIEYWKRRLAPARARLEAAVPSVGRIEMRNHASMPWAGTGWLVADEILATNRHVAHWFACAEGGQIEFRRTPEGNPIETRIDMLEEHERSDSLVFDIREVLHMEEDRRDRPDLAFLRVSRESTDGTALPDPIPLASYEVAEGASIGAIGYAKRDGARNPGDDMDRIFGGVYQVKRLHPGTVMSASDLFFTHDCSTLGGNSGSVMIDFDTGEAVGLHFYGTFCVANYALRAATVRQCLDSAGLPN